MQRALLIQLPVPGFRWPRLDANVPLAAGYLASWARRYVPGWRVDVLPWQESDTLGDEALLATIQRRTPHLVGFSLYVWNVERSLDLARRLAEAGTAVVFGGPEISSDNLWLWDVVEPGVAFAGEGEKAFAELLCLSEPIPQICRRGSGVDLSRLESPYLEGVLGPHPDGSVWVETARGCPFRCAYCNYGKRFAGPRPFRPGWLIDHLEWAKRSDAGEVYLMDPSFNARRDWEGVLATLEVGNRAGSLAYHTEIVADLLRPGDGDRLARAGLRSCEVGLQSIHADVLAAVNRRWDRRRWVRGVRELVSAGVSVVVGLIVGLPGDSLDRFSRSLEFVLTEVPGAEIQVFPLALLPGTELRARAREFGLGALERPPYTITHTAGYSPEDLATAFHHFEVVTGLELDPMDIPRLAGPWEGGEESPYLSGICLDARRAAPGWVDRVSRRATHSFTLWVLGWAETLPSQLARLTDRLPNGVLTVVLEDGAGWPPERLDRLLATGRRDGYLQRHLGLLYGASARVLPRLVVLVDDHAPGATPAWVAQTRTRADLLWALDAAVGWTERARTMAGEGENVYVRGLVDAEDLRSLAQVLGVDTHGVAFSSAQAQATWERLTGTDGFRAPEYRISVP